MPNPQNCSAKNCTLHYAARNNKCNDNDKILVECRNHRVHMVLLQQEKSDDLGFLEGTTLRTQRELRGSGLTGEFYAFVI